MAVSGTSISAMTARLPSDPVEPVRCRAEFRNPQFPVEFTWDGRLLLVEKILTEARTPSGINFRVATTEQETYTLEFDFSSQTWRIAPC